VCHHYCKESIESSDTVEVYRGVAKTRAPPFTTGVPSEITFVLPTEKLIKDVDGIDGRRVSAQQVSLYHVPGGGGRPRPSSLCEQWEHVECIKVFDCPSLELYTVLSVTSSKAIMFMCTSCRRKGTLARCLAEAEIMLSSLHTQLNVYQQLLHERQQLLHECQQLVGCITSERNVLQLENAELREQLAEARQLVKELRAKDPMSSAMKSKPLSVSAPEFVSATLLGQPDHVNATDCQWWNQT